MAQFSGTGSLGVSGFDTRVDSILFINANPAGALRFQGFAGKITNCRFDGGSSNTAIFIDNEDVEVTGCRINYSGGTAIRIDESTTGVRIVDNHIVRGDIETDTLQECVIADNQLYGETALEIGGQLIFSTISGNTWFNGITVANGITESVIEGNVVRAPTGFAIDVNEGAYKGVISDNELVGGIRWEDSYLGEIINNNITALPDGIVLAPGSFGSEYTLVQGNQIEEGTSGGDGIRIEDGAVDVTIQNNKVLSYGGMARGVHIDDSTCDDAVVFANSLGASSSYTVGEFVDNSSSTLTAPGGNGQFSH